MPDNGQPKPTKALPSTVTKHVPVSELIHKLIPDIADPPVAQQTQAQLDRFAMKLSIGYPAAKNEEEMLAMAIGKSQWDRSNIASVIDIAALAKLQEEGSRVELSSGVRRYLLALGHKTREDARVTLGISPRGLLTWQALAQSHAYLDNRDFATPEDIQSVAKPVLSVRLECDSDSIESLVEELLQSVPVPLN